MKTVLLVCALSIPTLLVGIFVWSVVGSAPVESVAEVGTAGPAGAPTAQPAAGREVEALRTRVAMLEQELTGLRGELERLRDEAARRPVASTEPEPAAAQSLELGRQTVLTILGEERDRQEAERQAERELRARQLLEARSERIALELGLGPADQATLTRLMEESARRRREVVEQVKLDGADRDTVRDQAKDLRELQTAELQTAFGEDLARSILEAERGDGLRGKGLDRLRELGRSNAKAKAGGGDGASTGTSKKKRKRR